MTSQDVVRMVNALDTALTVLKEDELILNDPNEPELIYGRIERREWCKMSQDDKLAFITRTLRLIDKENARGRHTGEFGRHADESTGFIDMVRENPRIGNHRTVE